MKKFLYFTLLILFIFIYTGCGAKSDANVKTYTAQAKNTSNNRVTFSVKLPPEKAEEYSPNPEEQQTAQTITDNSNPSAGKTPNNAPGSLPLDEGTKDVNTLINNISMLRAAEKGQSFSCSDPEVMETYYKAKEIVAAVVKPGMTEFEKEKALHDYMLLRTTYDRYGKNSYNQRGPLIDGRAACQGYSWAFKLLMNLAGIECKDVEGLLAGAPHAWDMAKIDGVWYHVDPTSDDGYPIRYDDFNKTDEQMRNQVHYWAANSWPACNTNFVWPAPKTTVKEDLIALLNIKKNSLNNVVNYLINVPGDVTVSIKTGTTLENMTTIGNQPFQLANGIKPDFTEALFYSQLVSIYEYGQGIYFNKAETTIYHEGLYYSKDGNPPPMNLVLDYQDLGNRWYYYKAKYL